MPTVVHTLSVECVCSFVEAKSYCAIEKLGDAPAHGSLKFNYNGRTLKDKDVRIGEEVTQMCNAGYLPMKRPLTCEAGDADDKNGKWSKVVTPCVGSYVFRDSVYTSVLFSELTATLPIEEGLFLAVR